MAACLPAPAVFPPPPDDEALAAELAVIATLPWAELRQRWLDVTGRPLPRVKQALLRMALASELQALALGGLPKRTGASQMRRSLATLTHRPSVETSTRPFGLPG